MPEHAYLACDLSARNGRILLGQLRDGMLETQVVHRFDHRPVRLFGSLRWDLLHIWNEICVGLTKAAERTPAIASVSVDSWGADYVWFNKRQPLLSLPYHFSDRRTEAFYQDVLHRLDAETVFQRSGIRLNCRHTLYQLADDLHENPEIVGAADGFLTIADYFNYLLSGTVRLERSMASTTQMYAPAEQAWATDLTKAIRLPEKLLPELVGSGTVVGALRNEVSGQTGLADAQVIATCSHASAAAIAAVPESGANWACLSSGSRSWLAREISGPILSEAARNGEFSNEAGWGGSLYLRKLLPGLWLYDECQSEWVAKRTVRNYEDLEKLAKGAKPLRSLVNLNAIRFSEPGDVAGKLRDCCLANGEMVPETPGQIVRCIVDSLALTYRAVLQELEDVTQLRTEIIHFIGGGSRHRGLNQLTADATNCLVEAGPVEVTAIGNLLIQAVALGDLDAADLRKVVRNSFPVETFTPSSSEGWEEAVERFRSLQDAL